MATVGEAEVLVHATVDLKQLQQLGWAARAVELAQQSNTGDIQNLAGEAQFARTNGSGELERETLLFLAACCLARLWEIR